MTDWKKDRKQLLWVILRYCVRESVIFWLRCVTVISTMCLSAHYVGIKLHICFSFKINIFVLWRTRVQKGEKLGKYSHALQRLETLEFNFLSIFPKMTCTVHTSPDYSGYVFFLLRSFISFIFFYGSKVRPGPFPYISPATPRCLKVRPTCASD